MRESVDKAALVAAGITAVAWGLEPFCFTASLDVVPHPTLSWCRFLIILLILSFVSPLSEIKAISSATFTTLAIILAAVGLFLNYFGFISSLSYLDPFSTVLIIQLGPLLFAGIGAFMEGRSVRSMPWLLLACTGFLIFAFSIMREYPLLKNGLLWGLLAALSWTVYACIHKTLSQRINPHLVNLFVILLVFIPLSFTVEFESLQTLLSRSPGTLGLLILASLLNAIAYISLGIALKRGAAAKVGVIVAMNPVITAICTEILLAMDMLNSSTKLLSPLGILGASLALIGISLSLRSKDSLKVPK